MTPAAPPPTESSRAAPPADEPPGVPGFRSWRAGYWFVAACFVATVALLAVFARMYSR
jgi:hypothetical protein